MEKYKGKYYFAHSKRIYNTPEEEALLNQLKSLGYDILCPNRNIGELNAVQPYLDIVSQCAGLIVHEYQGFIGRGAYEETKLSLILNKPTFVIRENELIKVGGIRVWDQNDWKIKYGKVLI